MSYSFIFDGARSYWYLRRSDGVEIRPGMRFRSVDGYDCEVLEVYQGWAVRSVEHRESGDYVHIDQIPRPDSSRDVAEKSCAVKKTLAEMGRI